MRVLRLLLPAIVAALACAGVDRHPCDWQPDGLQVEDPGAHDATPADCDAAAIASPATTSTKGPG